MAATPIEGVPVVLDALVQRVDKLASGVATMHEDNRVHQVEDAARFAAVEVSLTGLAKSVDAVRDDMSTAADKVVGAAEKQADRSAADRRWLIGLALGIIVTVITAVGGSFLMTRDRVNDLENSRDATDKTLDRLENRLEGIGNRLGVPASAGAGS